MTRYSLLDPPHKGIRNLLGQWALASGNTDVHDPDALTSLKGLTERVVTLLEDHARNEQAWVFPLLDQHEAGATNGLQREHEQLDRQLERARDAIAALTTEATASQVTHAHLAVTEFQAHYLLHLAAEEREFEPRLWSVCTDEQLLAAEAEVARDLNPQLLLEWFAACAPARTIPEIATVLVNVRQVLPPEAFAAVMATLEGALPVARFHTLLKRITP